MRPFLFALAVGSLATSAAAHAASTVAGNDKVAVMPARMAAGVPFSALDEVNAAIASGLSLAGLEPIAASRLAALDQQKKVKLFGCTSLACLGRVAESAGGRYAIAVSFARAKNGVAIKLLLVDASDSTVVESAEGVAGSPDAGALIEVLRELVPRAVRRIAHVALPPGPAKLPPSLDKPAPSSALGASSSTGLARPSPSAQAVATAGDAAAADRLLSEGRQAYESMDYDRAGALAARVLSMPGLDDERRLDAYLLQATSLAITSGPEAAEVPFRLLLRARRGFDLPNTTSPKILGAFRKVQLEERMIAEQVRAVGRNRLIAELTLLSEPPVQARGGRSLPFSLRLRDPTSVVASFEVPFRREGETSYSVLALKRDPEGSWRGAIPADWTANETSFVLEYYLVTRDDSGPLLSRGSAEQPLRLSVSAGTIGLPKPIPRWAAWVGVGAVGATLAATGGLGIATLGAQSDYDRYAQKGLTTVIDGSELRAKSETGHRLATATLGTAITAAVLAAATAALIPFLQEDEEPAPEAHP
ncbi:MAG: hypothetical protein HY901_32895 [Deltaproteobacteria bacterium]|nr:hypothetical protein [Deltaproteobacteria bacterium]